MTPSTTGLAKTNPSNGDAVEMHAGGKQTVQTVLVAEDNFELRNALAMMLERAGYRVLLATDGAEAVELACRESPDAVLMDLMMPVMDGFTAAARLRTTGTAPRVPILAFSAHVTACDTATGAQLFDAFLPKPVRAAELLCQIGSLLRPRTVAA